MTIAESYSCSSFRVLRKPIQFPTGCTHLHFHSTVCKGSVFPHPANMLFVFFFDSRHSARYEVTSHCGFDQHFPNG